MPRCLVALGSNLGDRASLVARAVEMLCAQTDAESPSVSQLYETTPVGGPRQAPYLNAAVALDTNLAVDRLHAVMRQIEDALGRRRDERWAARTIDLDLLLYGDDVVHTAQLIVPHPRMAFRRFVLEPAAEVAPEMVHPKIGWSVARLLEHLNTAEPYVAMVGLPGSGKTSMAQRLAAALDGRWLADPALRDAIAVDKPTTGAASPAYGREIELLEGRARLLDRRNWPEAGVLAVSDFYLDQCLAYAELGLRDSERATFCDAFRAARAEVVLPKLLVVLDTPRSVGGVEQLAAEDAAVELLSGKLLELAARRGLGPVLYAGATESDARFAEISAAIEAMQ